MKRILVRAGMSPLVGYDPMDVIYNNLIGNNIGNMLFPYSVSRTLMREDVLIDTINPAKKCTKWDIKTINEKYDCLVLPFANAFRASFIGELKKVTKLVKQLKIPCIVVGVGAQAGIDKTIKNKELDDAVKEFMKAILQKSAIVGLRGEFTAEYLKQLGFTAEKDYTVIGCPSMYMYGKELPAMEVKELTPDSNVSTNSKISLSQKFHDFMYRSRQAIPNYHYVPQVIEEISRMYMGKPYPSSFCKKVPNHFPVEFTDPMYQSGKGITFVNVPSWLNYLSEKDFSFGSRIHGNIASILAGTPCYIVVSDSRIKELVDYHHIPYMLEKDLKDDTNIFDLHNKADFGAIRKGHEERFMRYLDFLTQNGLKTIYDKDGNIEKSVPFDERLKETTFAPRVEAFSAVSAEEQLNRLQGMHSQVHKQNVYFKNVSPGIKNIVSDWFHINVLGQKPGPHYSRQPLVRRYKAELKRTKKKVEE
ncbi:MAG: polysaccharide pyruvyl transferase family protein [Butyribacter sp.]|nr:polysaccharide pyruvyl transferase family protein [bacterium]MDY3855032.1 polysaccharide pyruvyl transferase family protein [Butyribacter sp.]